MGNYHHSLSFETIYTGEPAISLLNKEIAAGIGHNGIKTLDEDSTEMNLMEW